MVNLQREGSYIIYLVSAFHAANTENPDTKVLLNKLSDSIKFPSLGSKVCLYFYLFL